MGNFLRNTSIGLKVSLAPAFAIVCLVIVAAVGWFANRASGADLQAIGVGGMKRIVNAQSFAREMTELHQQVYQSLTWEAIGHRPEKIKELDDLVLQRLKSFEAGVKAAAGAPQQSPEQAQTLAELAREFGAYAKSVRDTLDIKSAGVATATSFVVTMDDQFRSSQALLKKFVEREQQRNAALVAASGAAAMRNSLVIAGTTLVALLLAGGLSWVFARAISQPLGEAAQLAGQLAQGDLTRDAADVSSDATGRVLAALGEVSRGLTGIVVDIRRTAEEINTAAGEIASGNTDLSSRTESTASALQQTAAAVEQLSTTIRLSAENAREANTMAHDASAVAREGGAMVADVVQTMDAINAQAKKIGEIIGTIDAIAFQTNILALNAAVEAARAGEQGRGFSVVASEVRTLAQRSAEAAREIRGLIRSSVEQIDAGAGKVQVAGQTMGRIVSAIERVASTVDDISRAATEQAAGIAQVNQSVSAMDESTQQNAAMVEQANAATESLRSQAERLVHMLTRFRTA
ncbi:MAG TPA: methyl-accepting chemotaxis protein [Ramlibacter sp.]|jgi:methyl-accepting chemotaxis protein|uniref:methyl-accepting chemotaxis protein n=1 Tax=Ramlibacter sp. TaxID=1917967 RepID=UPI002D563CFD|nr:methyl-accepting chemotaxis protein [Ramlibacter sp.]HZY18726.1 methyl-accepting chemotaxis protein [Ramlibacter sp.]